jgi:hypothetical protein
VLERYRDRWDPKEPPTIVVDKEGVIRYDCRGKTFGDRPKPDEILKELVRVRDRFGSESLEGK